MKPTLFNLAEDVHILLEALDNTDDAELKLAVEQYLNVSSDQLNVKIDSYGVLIKEHEARSKALKEEAGRLLDLHKSYENSAKRLKSSIDWVMQNILKIKRINSPRFVFNIQNVGGPRALIQTENIDLDKLDNKYVVTYKTLNTDQLRSELNEYEAELEALSEIPTADNTEVEVFKIKAEAYEACLAHLKTKYASALALGYLAPRGKALYIK